MGEDARELILDVYDTVADAARWPSVLQKFADRIDAFGCVVFEWDDAGPQRRISAPLYSTGYDPELVRHYIDAFHEWEAADHAVFEQLSLASDGVDLIGDEVLAPTEAELLARPNARQLLDWGIRHRYAGLLNKDNPQRGRFSVQYAADHGPPTDEERRLMLEVLPHIAKAMELGRPAAHLASLQRSLVAAMDRLRVGVCILDGKGRVVATNEEFERQREAHAAFRVDRAGRLRLHRGADAARFEALLADALNHGRHGARPRKEAVPTTQEDGIGALCIEVAPLDEVAEIGTTPLGGAIVYSLDASLPTTCDAAALRRVFGLTGAEAELAELVADGLTNVQIAERRARSVETVNAQVKSILGKTQCANRTQLVRLMTSFSTDFLRADEV